MARPLVVVKPTAHPRVAAKPQPHPHVAANFVPHARLASKVAAPATIAPSLAKTSAKPQATNAQLAAKQSTPFELKPAAASKSQQITRLAPLPALLAKMQTTPVVVKKPLSVNAVPSLAISRSSRNVVAVSTHPISKMKSFVPAAKPGKKKHKIFKPAHGGHGIAIVRPWQGSIPDSYCDLPTGCGTPAPAAPGSDSPASSK